MLVVISPAKSLCPYESLPDSLGSVAGEPIFIEKTKTIAEIMKTKSTTEIKALMDVSNEIAERTYDNYQNFEIDTQGHHGDGTFAQAGLLFDGPAFRGLDCKSLPPASIPYLQKTVRFISGFYGLLKPCDLIQNHRLCMDTKPLQIGSCKNLYNYWGDSICAAINEDILVQTDSPNKVLLNCASDEYAKAIPFDKLDASIQVVDCVFRDRGKVIATYAKKARGLMARWVAMHPQLQHSENPLDIIKDFNYEGYEFSSLENSKKTKRATLVFDRSTVPQKESKPKQETKASKSAKKKVTADASEEDGAEGVAVKKRRTKK